MNDPMQLILAFIGGIACGLSLSALLCLVYSRFRYVWFTISILFIGMMIYAVQVEDLINMISAIFWMSAFLNGIILGFAMENIYGRSLREKNGRNFCGFPVGGRQEDGSFPSIRAGSFSNGW